MSRSLATVPLARKVRALSGALPFWRGLYAILRSDYYHRHPFRTPAVPELGLPGLAFSDGPRGVVLAGGATTFPVPMARGATWDPELETRIGEAMGRELRALGANLLGAVCVNLLRHPAWGRAQETYGEDPVHVGALGAALVRGIERHALACVKHFAANSMENARFVVDVEVSPRALHEVYLPQFKACVDAGASAVMSAYNSVNGAWCGQNRALLTEVLRDRWGFDGVVLTDFVFGVRDARAALAAGLDLEMPFRMVFGDALVELVRQGEVDAALVDRALERLARVQRRLPPATGYGPADLGRADHQALAREAAREAIVLLKNDGALLPLGPGKTLVVVGRLADTPNLGDRGSSDTRPDHVVTPLAGLRARFGDRVTFVPDLQAPGAAEQVRAADAVLAVVGYTEADEGEHVQPPDITPFLGLFPPPLRLPGVLRRLWRWLMAKVAPRIARRVARDRRAFGKGGDRARLTLRPADEALILAAADLNPNLAVAVMGGSAILMEAWKARARAILMLWYPGMEGGHALADVVSGDHAPSGRLPFTIPTSPDHLPPFDRDATSARYDLWHGYRLLDWDGHAPAFPFGHGLSYVDFAYGAPAVEPAAIGPDGAATVTVPVTNLGAMEADEVVQLYVEPPAGAVERPGRVLAAFARLRLAPGATGDATLQVPASALAVFDEAADALVAYPGVYRLLVARNVRDPDARVAKLTVTRAPLTQPPTQGEPWRSPISSS